MRGATLAGERHSWLAEQFEGLTTEIVTSSPSEWAERRRYIPAQNSALPGYYRFDVTPYWREVCDCFAQDSPISEVAVIKGVQLGATTALENIIGYLIDEVKSAPSMYVTADAELAVLRMTLNIIPMLQASDLMHLIRSSDETNKRKSGKTDKKLEWFGGGFLIPFGAQNANKLRSIPIRYMLRDEIDAWPDLVGKDGDPIALTTDRTAAYEAIRKILDISTPLIKGQSKIEKAFKRGDQRYYFVRCLHCGRHQTLKFRRENPETGERTGIVWEPEGDGIARGSVRYLCRYCGGAHTNEDKVRLFDPANDAQWKPTATPIHPNARSYHLSALYSPPGQQTWEACVLKWLEAWDEKGNRPRDMGKLQVVYNNVFAEPFELRAERLKLEQVSPHKRHCYRFGEVPNKWAARHAGSPILILTCSVDVHKSWLAVEIMGWTKEQRGFLIDYHRLDGDTSQLDDPGTWGALAEIIETRVYTGDDGKTYRISLTGIDTGYKPDKVITVDDPGVVHRFVKSYTAGVIALKGDHGKQGPKAFRFTQSTLGEPLYTVLVDTYKDRWGFALKRGWDGQGLQPTGHFNAPIDITDKQLEELTVERKVEQIDPRSRERIGWKWHRPSGARNELWDCLIYNTALLEIVAADYCKNQLELDQVLWPMFWDHCEKGAYFSV